jgi:hypothetical protein
MKKIVYIVIIGMFLLTGFMTVSAVNVSTTQVTNLNKEHSPLLAKIMRQPLFKTIKVHVFFDYDKDGVQDYNEENVASEYVQIRRESRYAHVPNVIKTNGNGIANFRAFTFISYTAECAYSSQSQKYYGTININPASQDYVELPIDDSW